MNSALTLRLALGAAVVAIGLPGEARAALGGDEASITADCVALGSTRQVTRTAGWEVHELRLPSGALVREYRLPSGAVFALAWSGPVPPNLRLLLGPYFQPYVQSPRDRPSSHHVRAVATPEWVVQSAGQQQSFLGRAWLPPQLPAGFDLDAVRAW